MLCVAFKRLSLKCNTEHCSLHQKNDMFVGFSEADSLLALVLFSLGFSVTASLLLPILFPPEFSLLKTYTLASGFSTLMLQVMASGLNGGIPLLLNPKQMVAEFIVFPMPD